MVASLDFQSQAFQESSLPRSTHNSEVLSQYNEAKNELKAHNIEIREANKTIETLKKLL